MDFLNTSNRRKQEPDLTPLINIIFLILIFFLLTAAIAPNEDILIEPVVSELEAATANADNAVIAIDATGVVFKQGQEIETPKLKMLLAGIAQVEPSQALSIKADATLDANALIELMVLAREVGIESVALMTVRR